MRIRYLQGISLLIGLFFVLTPLASSVDTAQWNDDFEDGTLDGWTVIYGDWDVADGYLRSDPRTGIKTIWRESTQVEGTWSFDVFHESACPMYETLYLFMATEADPNSYDGYGLLLSCESIYLVKQDGESGIEALDFVMESGLANTWTHFDITRNSTTSEIRVFTNATSFIEESSLQAVDLDYTTSTQFVVKGVGCDCYIDNVAVVNEILFTEPGETLANMQPSGSVETTSNRESNLSSLEVSLYLLGSVCVGVLVALVLALTLKKK